MLDERELAIEPIVGDSLQHNARVISNIRSLTSSLFGIAAGALGLEAYAGFAFYLLGSVLVSVLVLAILVPQGGGGKAGARAFFHAPVSDLWMSDVFGGLSSFVLTWTLVYNLIRA